MIDALQTLTDLAPRAMCTRRRLVEHPFATIKAWMGHTHFLIGCALARLPGGVRAVYDGLQSLQSLEPSDSVPAPSDTRIEVSASGEV